MSPDHDPFIPPPWGEETTDERMRRLSAKARSLAHSPGVYLMKDHNGVVLYVGKAISLPDRVASYFVPSTDLGPQKQPMLDLVHDFEVLLCESEWEALLTENRLIKDIKPRFNVRLTDDKTFPYLAITRGEDFPRVFVTRNPSDPELKGARIYGPFAHAGALREAVQVLQRVFRFRTCKLDIIDGDPKNSRFRPCLLYAIDQCTAPCAAKIDKERYGEDIDQFVHFLGTKRSQMMREMREEMKLAAEAMKFERAAKLRDQIASLEKLDQRASKSDNWQPEAESVIIEPEKALQSLQRALSMEEPIRCIDGFDIAHLQGNETVASKVCFIDGRPLKSEYRRFRIESAANDDFSSMREVISRRYRDAGAGEELYPDVILIDGGIGQLNAALEVFDSLNVKPPMVISLAKKEELIFVRGSSEPIKLGRENPGLRLLQSVRDEAHRFAQHYHHVLRRKRVLGEDDGQ